MKVIGKDGTARIKLIAPVQGTSGYYPAETLKRDGPKVFKAGTQMFLDHATSTEESGRPEGSLRDMAGVLATDAVYHENGSSGPGLYADVKIFKHFQPLLEEMAPHIGVSIRAFGKAKEGEINGKKTRVIETISAAKSVDFVTRAGAGGRFEQLLESARQCAITESATGQIPAGEPAVTGESHEGVAMNEADVKALREAQAETAKELKRLREARIRTDAREVIDERLKAVQLPAAAKQKLRESLLRAVPVKDDEVDAAALGNAITEAIKSEGEYIAALTGSTVKGMGGALVQESGITNEQFEKRMKESFIAQGMSPEAAELAAKEAA